MLKYCPKCEVQKPIEDFHNDKNRRDGKYPNCKECHYHYMRSRYRDKPGIKEARANYAKDKRILSPKFREEERLRSEKFYASKVGRAKSLLNNSKKSKTTVALGNTLELSFILERLEHGICEATGIPFVFTNEDKLTAKHHFSPSLDRIDSKKGYHPENCRVVIWQYNMMKGEISDEQLMSIMKTIMEFRNVVVS